MAEDLTGRTLRGKYRLESLLGQGGMGSVWKGVHVVTGRRVAIKVLDERFMANANTVRRFGREARAASAVQHDGIVEVLDLDRTDEGAPYLVMEFLEGETLSRRIERRRRLSQEDTLRIATPLLEALEAAHQHGVVHRDLKPDNIFLVPHARGDIVKILDFGISQKEDEIQIKLTMTGSVLGTPHYMSPEQAMGEANLDKRVDIYAAGVVLYECLVGDVPFDAPNYNKLLRIILDEEPIPPSERGLSIAPEFEAVILAAMAKERNARPSSARELLDRLTRAARPASRSDPANQRAKKVSTTFAKPVEGARPISDSKMVSSTRAIDGAAEASVATQARASSSQSAVAAARWSASPASLPPPSAPSARGPSPIPPPRMPASLPPASGGLGLGGFDDFDVFAGPTANLELDESAMTSRSRAPSSLPGPRSSAPSTSPSARSSGAHRRVSDEPGPSSGPARLSPRPSPIPPDARRSPIPPPGRTPSPLPPSSSIVRSSGPRPAAPVPSAPAPAQGRPYRRWIAIALAALAVFGAIVAVVRWVVQPGARPDDAMLRDGPTGSPEPPPATHDDWVHVTIDGVPTHARIRVDGVPGAALPLRVRRGGEHVVEIHAEGYEDRELRFTADADQRLHAHLRPGPR